MRFELSKEQQHSQKQDRSSIIFKQNGKNSAIGLSGIDNALM
jgi:hypothetical protein